MRDLRTRGCCGDSRGGASRQASSLSSRAYSCSRSALSSLAATVDPSRDALGDLGAQGSATRGQLQELDPTVAAGDAFEHPQLLQAVGQPGDVGGVAGQVVGQGPHGRRLLEEEHGACLQRGQTDIADHGGEVGPGALGHLQQSGTEVVDLGETHGRGGSSRWPAW